MSASGSDDGALAAALGEELGARSARLAPVSGGSINAAFIAELDDGRRVFVKTRDDAPAGEYATEAAGLRWLAEPGAIAVPEPLAVRDGAEAPIRFLALEAIDAVAGAPDPARLGAGLAALHLAGASHPAAAPPGAPGPWWIGPLKLTGVAPGDTRPFAQIYAEERLLPLLEQARDRGSIDSSGAAAVERVCERITELAGPAEPPARLHGDLWSGNVLAGTDGTPWLIDPAAYGGHRELDLAMLELFGSPGPSLLSAYEDVHPLSDGHRDRVELWQLLPLLVHAVLFGGSYGASAAAAARRYL